MPDLKIKYVASSLSKVPSVPAFDSFSFPKVNAFIVTALEAASLHSLASKSKNESSKYKSIYEKKELTRYNICESNLKF